jgi:hypothetical protein
LKTRDAMEKGGAREEKTDPKEEKDVKVQE